LGAFYDPDAPPLASAGAVSGKAVAAVPEPATVILLGILFISIAALATARRGLRIARRNPRGPTPPASAVMIPVSSLCFPTRFPSHREASP
jgi:hypothetical protein